MKTAESVTPSHPDKMCDRISDSMLDLCLAKDPMARVALETVGGHGRILIIGEVTTKAIINWEFEAEKIVKRITGKHNMNVEVKIVQQSPEIANGVDTGGAGDQGIMTGYACNDNEAMIPQEAWLARNLAQTIYSDHPYDGKTQITLLDDGSIKSVVASFQNATQSELTVIVSEWLKDKKIVGGGVDLFVNPAGDWVKGGFDADTGLTGRKLMVDNYGPQIAVGGGCFSGKDATKVDRSAAYMARKMAVEILQKQKVPSMLPIEVVVKLAYAIGVAEPVMVDAKVNGKHFPIIDTWWDLTPKGIIENLDLRRPQYEKTAEWGHFGLGFTWDK